MNKKIGFIDYYLDEWHANNYPAFLKESSKGRYEICCAYAKIDNPNGKTNEEWSKEHNIPLANSIEEVIEKSDFLIVLSPDNCEMHEELSNLPLKSGKPTYIDKTFAPDKATALRIFENADKHNTKCYSSSALRFASEWNSVDKSKIERIYSEGPGTFETYSIHQIEPIVMLMECRAKRVMFLGSEKHPEMIIEFENGKTAHMFHRNDPDYSFEITTVSEDNSSQRHKVVSNFFILFIEDLIRFFDTGEVLVPHSQTVDVIAIIEAGKKAMETPFCWINI